MEARARENSRNILYERASESSVQTNFGPLDELLAEFGPTAGRDGPRAHLVSFLLPKRAGAAVHVPSSRGCRVGVWPRG
jgi:hypothetical protein